PDPLLMNRYRELLRKTIPPVYFLAALLLMVLLAYFLPLVHLVYVPLRICGGVIVLIGLAMTATGAWTFKRADTPVRPFELATTLVTAGVYRYSRNPMYLGLLVMLIGVWIALGKLSPLLVIPFFFFIIREGFVIPEEEFLEKIFGDVYLNYKSRVRRWI
ncbi:MAG: methyltransferase family protein, partial [Gammaproteobacteria bacterium]